MKVTPDTNVLVSGTFWTGDSFEILDLIDKRKIGCVLSEEILREYNRIAVSGEILEKVESKKLIILKSIEKIISNSTIVIPKRKINIAEDKDDNKILECAVEGKVDYIITQDNHLLRLKEFEGIKILIPGEFLKLLK